MGPLVYILSAVTSLACAALLLRGYRASRVPLLLWSGLCFLGLTLENVLLYVDLAILSKEVSLETPRNCVTLVSLVLLAWGLIWNRE